MLEYHTSVLVAFAFLFPLSVSLGLATCHIGLLRVALTTWLLFFLLAPHAAAIFNVIISGRSSRVAYHKYIVTFSPFQAMIVRPDSAIILGECAGVLVSALKVTSDRFRNEKKIMNM